MVVWKFTHNQIDAVRFYQLLLSSDLCWSCCQCRGTWRLFFTYLEKLRTGPGEDRMAWNISFIPSGTIDGLLIRFSFYGIYDICLLIEWTCWREKIEKGLIYLVSWKIFYERMCYSNCSLGNFWLESACWFPIYFIDILRDFL